MDSKVTHSNTQAYTHSNQLTNSASWLMSKLIDIESDFIIIV